MGNDLGIDLKRLQRINPLLKRFIGEGNQLPGAQTLVWRRGQLVDFQSTGFRDRENRLPVEEDTIFRIHAMTKPLISFAMMMLFEQGHFQLSPRYRNSFLISGICKCSKGRIPRQENRSPKRWSIRSPSMNC